MELTIQQSVLAHGYEYSIYQSNEVIFTAKANYHGLLPTRRIQLYDLNDKEICRFNEENWKANILRTILRVIPIISLFSFSICPYIYSKNEVDLGYMRIKFGGYAFGIINGENYELWSHTTPNTSIYCNRKQVGLIIKQIGSRRRYRYKYKVLFSKSLSKELAAMLCLLSDILWENSNLEHSIQIGGKKFDSSWLPEG